MLNKKIIDGMGNLGKASGDLCFLKGTLESKIRHLEEIKEKGYLGLDIDGTIKDMERLLAVVKETQTLLDTGTNQIIEGWAEREQTEKPAFQIWGEIAYTFGQGEKSARGLVEWLFSEYEPPLLKNGDGLKPGDWIMVRDEDDQIWKKKRFLSFANGSFYCIKSLFGSHDGKTNRDLYGEFVCYRQARLPEDGE